MKTTGRRLYLGIGTPATAASALAGRDGRRTRPRESWGYRKSFVFFVSSRLPGSMDGIGSDSVWNELTVNVRPTSVLSLIPGRDDRYS